MAVACFLLMSFQDDVRSLIERLGSDRVEERDAAETGLEALGLRALPELERARRRSDPELSWRARRLARLIPFRHRLSPAIRKALPELEEGILQGVEPQWGNVFKKLESVNLEARDLERLVGPALEATALPKEKIWICETARQHGCRPHVGDILPGLAGLDLFQVRSLAEWLHLLDLPEATGDLAEALGSAHAGIRSAARTVIFGRREHDAIPPLDRAWASPDAEARREGVLFVRDLALREHIPDLLGRLSDADPGVREAAAGVLVGFGERAAIPRLAGLLEDCSHRVRTQAIRSLVDLGAKEHAGAVAARLRDSEPAVRAAALSALGIWEAHERAGELVPLLDDPVYWVREAAFPVLKQLGSRTQAPQVRSLLGHRLAAVRAEAIDLLATLEGAEALPAVAVHLRDPEALVRRRAVDVVAQWGAREFLPDLAALVYDSDDPVAAAAFRAVRRMDVLEPDDLVRLFRSPRPEIRRLAGESLVRAVAKKEAAGLLDLLDSGDERTRSDTLELIRDLHLEEGVEAVIRRLEDPSGTLRILAAETLQHLQGVRAIPRLQRMLESDSSSLVQRAAAEALGRLGAKEAWPALVGQMMWGSDYARRLAVGALARVCDRGALESLWQLADDEEPSVRFEALKCLVRRGEREAATILAWGVDETNEVSLFALNAARSPDSWERLSKLKAARGGGGTWRRRLEALAEEAGLAIEWDGVDPDSRSCQWTRCPRSHATGASLLEALEELIEDGPYEAVLEEGRIRVLSAEDARLLFRLWDESR